MWRVFGPILLATGLPAAQKAAPLPWAPPDSIRWALTDLRTLPPSQQRQTRYLDLGSVPAAQRPALIQVLSGHVNGLSREPDLVAPAVVRGTSGGLLRLDLDDYGWPASVWEQLQSPYHQTEVVQEYPGTPWPGGTWHEDGRYYAPGSFTYRRRQRTVALAPWLSGDGGGGVAELVRLTQSKAPIVSGQWFLWQTAIQEGRKPGYYDFLGVKDQRGFEALVRFDAKLAAKLEQRRVVIFSGVTQEPRRVERTHTVLGGLWRTFDSAEAVGEKNPIRILNGELKFDVTEQLAPLPNGMLGSYLGNAAGQRQDKAPDNVVAGDRTSPKDGRLHINLGCIHCHLGTQGASGIMDIDAVPIRQIRSVDYDKLRELRRQYLRDLTPLMEADRRGYEAAIKQATGGMTARNYAQEYSRWFLRLDLVRVDAAWAGRDLGYSGEEVVGALRRYDGATGNLDAVLSILASGGAIPVRQYHEALPILWQALKGGGR